MNVPMSVARRCSDEGDYLTLGEGPLWDGANGRVLWVDIANGLACSGRLAGDHLVVTGRLSFPGTVGAVLPAVDGGLVVAGARDVHTVDPSGHVTSSIPVIDRSARSRLNDAVCDERGRLLVGTLPLDGRRNHEAVLRVDPSGAVTTVVDGLTLANGMAFSPDGSVLYLVDSIPGVIHAFDYDMAAGRPGARREVWTSRELVPDGLTVDAAGDLWIAYFGAGQVRRLSPLGEVLEIVEVPAPNTTCASFVGEMLDQLLITTAREQLDDQQLARFPDSGGVFLAHVDARGLPAAVWGGSTMRKTVD
jgi:sugar lactone lactonase YvrE